MKTNAALTNNFSAEQLLDLARYYSQRAHGSKTRTAKSDAQKVFDLSKKALKKFPLSGKGWLILAYHYRLRKNKLAIKYFKKALPFYPKDRKCLAFHELSRTYDLLNQPLRAEQWYLKALKAESVMRAALLS